MYEDRIIAYIDVLGFSEAVKKTVQDSHEIQYETKKIDNLINEVEWQLIYKDICLSNYITKNSKVTSQFSDTIIISYSMTDGLYQLLLDIYLLCIVAIQNGFLLRGAIVRDKIYHTKEKIFGPALIKAHNMEQKMSIYPRVILDNAILNFTDEQLNQNTDHSALMNLLLCDSDGLYFINYFDKLETGVDCGLKGKKEHFGYLKEIINKMESIIENDFSIKIKYLWVKEQYKKALINFKNTNADIQNLEL